jgi:hypothetical protein
MKGMSLGTQYASRVSEQFPARGKISLEIIKDLYQMSTDLLKLFAQRNGCFPNKIVFYRDGKKFVLLNSIFNLSIRSGRWTFSKGS